MPGLDPALLTDDAAALVRRDDVDLVVEVIGGIEPARSWLLAAMEHGKSVVTANKALLAEDGATLLAAAEKHGVDLYYEAAVAGAIPLLRPLRESLVGDRVRRVLGIVNGTTNYILTRMDETGAGFAEALDEATALGYAEADPTADVEGFDAAAKAAILASLAFHTRVTAADVHREGITEVTAADVASAARWAASSSCWRSASGPRDGCGVSVRVHPAMIPRTHPLAGVREAFNAVFVEAEAAGRADVLRPGRRRRPDRQRGARRPRRGGPQPRRRRPRAAGVALRRPRGPADGRDASRATTSASTWPTSPACWPAVAAVFAEHGVSIETVRQQQHVPGPEWWVPTARVTRRPDAELVIVTHAATDEALSADRGGAARPRHRPSGDQRDAGGRGLTVSRDRGGVSIEEYRDRLPVSASTPVVTLREGGTPLRAAPGSCPSAPGARCTSRSRAPTRPAPSRTAA